MFSVLHANFDQSTIWTPCFQIVGIKRTPLLRYSGKHPALEENILNGVSLSVGQFLKEIIASYQLQFIVSLNYPDFPHKMFLKTSARQINFAISLHTGPDSLNPPS